MLKETFPAICFYATQFNIKSYLQAVRENKVSNRKQRNQNMMHQRIHQKSQEQSACTNRQPSCKVFVNVMVYEKDALPSKYKMFFFSSC